MRGKSIMVDYRHGMSIEYIAMKYKLPIKELLEIIKRMI
jgi:Mor family transcriptional regulator